MDTNLIKESLVSIKEQIAAIEQALAAPPVAPVIVAPVPVITAPVAMNLKVGTAHQAGLSGKDCLPLILRKILSDGGESQMQDLYRPIELRMNKIGWTLSAQGESTIRNLVNEIAVEKGYIKAYDPNFPGWRITKRGEAFLDGEI